jgi:hypothetical protein
VLRAPGEDRVARLIDRSGDTPVELTHFIGSGSPRRAGAFDPAPLRASRIPQPDLTNAARLSFVFDAGEAAQLIFAALDDAAGAMVGSLCLSERIFWTINSQPWPDRNHSRLPPPLAVLKRGQSYILELENKSSFMHPIHIHGHTFSFLRSNNQTRASYRYAATAAAGKSGSCLRGRQSRRLDAPLSCHRASRERDDGLSSDCLRRRRCRPRASTRVSRKPRRFCGITNT